MKTVQKTLRFRPQELSKRFRIRERLYSMPEMNYNWQTRTDWFPAGYTSNMKCLSKQFSRIHHFACHAPGPVQQHWKRANQLFMKQHFTTHASMRYANKYSCDAWL